MEPIPEGHVRVTVESPTGACFVALVQDAELKTERRGPEYLDLDHGFLSLRNFYGPPTMTISGKLKAYSSEIRSPNPKPEPERL